MSAITRRRAAVAALALGLAVIGGCSPVTQTWASSTIRLTYGPTLPAGAMRDRAREASANWAGIGLPARSFSASPAGAQWTSDPCANLGRGLVNGLHVGPIDGPGGILASTQSCVRTDRPEMANVDIVFDAQEVWWTSDSSAISPRTIDFESVATHELGHAWGWLGDHLSGTPCNPGPSRATMCADLPPGSVGQRTPQKEDRNPIARAYGGPVTP